MSLMKIVLTLGGDCLSILESSELEREVHSAVLVLREARSDHHSVGVNDSVKGESGSFDWVFVHFYLVSF